MDPGITEEHISLFLFSAILVVRDGNAKLDLMIQVRMSRFQDTSLGTLGVRFKKDRMTRLEESLE